MLPWTNSRFGCQRDSLERDPFFWVLNYEPAAGDLEFNPAVHNDNKA